MIKEQRVKNNNGNVCQNMRCIDVSGSVCVGVNRCNSWRVCAGKDGDRMVEYDRT